MRKIVKIPLSQQAANSVGGEKESNGKLAAKDFWKAAFSLVIGPFSIFSWKWYTIVKSSSNLQIWLSQTSAHCIRILKYISFKLCKYKTFDRLNFFSQAWENHLQSLTFSAITKESLRRGKWKSLKWVWKGFGVGERQSTPRPLSLRALTSLLMRGWFHSFC